MNEKKEMTIKEAVERLDAIRSEMNARDRMAIDMVTDGFLVLNTAKKELREKINTLGDVLAEESLKYDISSNMGSYPGLLEAEKIIKKAEKQISEERSNRSNAIRYEFTEMYPWEEAIKIPQLEAEGKFVYSVIDMGGLRYTIAPNDTVDNRRGFLVTDGDLELNGELLPDNKFLERDMESVVGVSITKKDITLDVAEAKARYEAGMDKLETDEQHIYAENIGLIPDADTEER